MDGRKRRKRFRGLGLAVYWDIDGWTGATITLTVSISETWDYDTEIGKAGSNLYHVAESFKAWANDASRSWASSRSFDYSIAASGVNVAITFTSSGSVVWVANSAFQAAAGVAASTVAASVVGSAVTHGLSAPYAFRNWVPYTAESEGTLSQSGSFYSDSFAGLAKFPQVTARLTPQQAFAEGLAVKQASTPRGAVFFDYTANAYRHIYVMDVTTRRGKREIYKSEIKGVEVL